MQDRYQAEEKIFLLADDELNSSSSSSISSSDDEVIELNNFIIKKEIQHEVIEIEADDDWRIQYRKEKERDNRKCIIALEGITTGVLTSTALIISLATVPEMISSQVVTDILGKIAWVVIPPAITLVTGMSCSFFHNQLMERKAKGELDKNVSLPTKNVGRYSYSSDI